MFRLARTLVWFNTFQSMYCVLFSSRKHIREIPLTSCTELTERNRATRVHHLQVLIFLRHCQEPRSSCKTLEKRTKYDSCSPDFHQQENTIFLKLFYRFSVPFSDHSIQLLHEARDSWLLFSPASVEYAVRVQMDCKTKQRANLSTISRVKRNRNICHPNHGASSVNTKIRITILRRKRWKSEALPDVYHVSSRSVFASIAKIQDHEIDAEKPYDEFTIQ